MVVISPLYFLTIYKCMEPVNEKELKGDYILKVMPELTWENWPDGSFQKKYSEYIEENIGLRNLLVELRNQLDYSLFNKANVDGVLIGGNGNLYDVRYIDAYYGDDFIGDDLVKEKLRKIKAVQDTLRKEGITFLLVLEPSKARYLPEHFPPFTIRKGSTSNYEAFADPSIPGIDFVDINKLFLSLKDTISYPLYTTSGIHWSDYGCAIAIREIIKRIEEESHSKLDPVEWSRLRATDFPSDRDYDVANVMNLLFEIEGPKTAYPDFVFRHENPSQKPDLLVLGDSYFWNIEGQGLFSNSFRNTNHWHYNKILYENGMKSQTPVQALDLKKELKKHDVILLMQTELTLYDLGWGFIEQVYDIYYPEDQETLVSYWERQILSDREWWSKVRKQAKKSNTPWRTALRNNALYAAENLKK